ncbi:MAG: outer membrane protein assembly factor BamB [Thiobacillaceae bacterium]|nr:outer membrane protein assembly factor BamB [Thiobacillaceae bacterium]
MPQNMGASVRRALALAALLALAGCGTISGWFGASSPKVKPAELTAIQDKVRLTRLWEANVGPGRPYVFHPASDGQAIYAAGRDGRIVRLDPASGREQWRIEAGRALSGGVGAGAGLVLVGTAKGELLAYRAADGQPAWTAQLSGEILTPPVVAGGLVLARGNDGKVWALEAADGRRRWVYSRALPALTLREPSGMTADERAVYAGFPGGRLVALALTNGAPLWEATVALPRGTNELERITDVTGPLAVDARSVCAAAYQGRIACFDRSNGQNLWSRDLSATRGVAGDARLLYAISQQDHVQAFDRSRGASPWKQDKLHGRQLGTPLPLAQGRYLAVADYQGYIHILDSDSGALIGRTATDGSPIPAPMLPSGNGLIAQTANGNLYAYALAATP